MIILLGVVALAVSIAFWRAASTETQVMLASQIDREDTELCIKFGFAAGTVRIPTKSAGDSGLMSATHSDLSRPAVPIDVGRGGIARGLG